MRRRALSILSMYYTPGWGQLVTAAVAAFGVTGTLTATWLGQRTTRQVAEDSRRHEHENQVSELAIQLVEQIRAELIEIDSVVSNVSHITSRHDYDIAKALEATRDDEREQLRRETTRSELRMQLIAPRSVRSSLDALIDRHLAYVKAVNSYLLEVTLLGTDPDKGDPTPRTVKTHGMTEWRFLESVKTYRHTTAFDN